MKTTNQAKPVDQIARRLHRIDGQVDGIIKMYEDERSCIEIVHQVVAARNALGSAARELLSMEARKCNRERNYEELDTVIKELMR